MSHETVGTLLAVIANSLNDALRAMMFADKHAWAHDEFEQLRVLEETLDLAKKDFQELPVLINGRQYYENDRTRESLEDLRVLCTRFELHARTFKDWLKTGGPVDPTWVIETTQLKRELHRAQCRAVRRIHSTYQQTRARCIGAQHVFKIQQRHKQQPSRGDRQQGEQQRLEETAACNQTGAFERFGDTDVAFVCDFCDGHIIWEDLREMPATRTFLDDPSASQGPGGGEELEQMSATVVGHLAPPGMWSNETMPFSTGMTMNSVVNSDTSGSRSTFKDPTSGAPQLPPVDIRDDSYASAQRQWQALGYSKKKGTEKPIVFAPLAIANHIPPEGMGEWQAGLLCPFCDEYYYVEQGDPDADKIKYIQNENGFEGLNALKEHLEWYHAPMVSSGSSGCAVM